MNHLITDYAPVKQFELIDPLTIREDAFQEDVARILSHIFPGDRIFRFNPRVVHDDAVWKPDLALVDSSLRFWFVIEVEVAYHSLEKHVIPQVTAFVEGRYGQDAVMALAGNLQIPKEQAATFLELVPRQVIVVSNRPDEMWTTKLLSRGVQHLAVSSFRSQPTGQLAHRVVGAMDAPAHSLAFAIVQAQENAIVGDASKIGDLGEFTATSSNGVATWQTVVVDGRAWLFKKSGAVGFPDGAWVQILRRSDGRLEMRMPYEKSSLTG